MNIKPNDDSSNSKKLAKIIVCVVLIVGMIFMLAIIKFVWNMAETSEYGYSHRVTHYEDYIEEVTERGAKVLDKFRARQRESEYYLIVKLNGDETEVAVSDFIYNNADKGDVVKVTETVIKEKDGSKISTEISVTMK